MHVMLTIQCKGDMIWLPGNHLKVLNLQFLRAVQGKQQPDNEGSSKQTYEAEVQVQQAMEYACCVLDVRGAAKKALCHCLAVRAPFSSLIEHSPPLSLCDCN
ncbi:unnamed protein product [Sphagnum jensenii]|uniref:Uncharacterized protein n=1 Tax=Sphagnum jensenii TaxID=128206 RepID=A0ABP1BGA0_9BRYO